MTATADRVPVPGSEREPMPGAQRVGPTDPSSEVTVSLILRPRDAQAKAAHLDGMAAAEQPLGEQVSHEQFAERFGADPGEIAKVREFATSAGLAIVEESAARRTVVLRGTAAVAGAAFGVELGDYEHAEEGRYRGREGVVTIPRALDGIVEAVLGLDARPQAKPRLRVAGQAGGAAPEVATAFTPPQVAQLYSFPTGAGRGQCIGIVELGGGFQQSDLAAYFSALHVTPPTVVAVGVDGATNAPGGGPNSDDGEVVLDIEVAGSIAHEARIAVYFAPNTTAGFLDAITTAIHDQVNKPSVISISWGSAELHWTAQTLHAMEAAFADAALLGITVCIAAGDNGAADGVNGGRANVDFPASAIHALACGGTQLEARPRSHAIASERVWNDGGGGATGGGISDHFPRPAWQASAGVPPSVNPGHHVGEGLPDVAGDADPATGYRIHIDGQDLVFGGTSAVAPLWAALVAIINERRGHRVGFINPVLYGARAHATFHDITAGDNAVPGTPGYQAAHGWDACTGLGSPNGTALLAAL